MRDFKLRNSNATQDEIASPSGLEYLMKFRSTLLTMSQVDTGVVERKNIDIRVFEGLR